MNSDIRAAARTIATIVAIACAGVTRVACAVGPATPESFSGSAYAQGNDTLLYRETHFVYAGAIGGERLVLYRCPDGRAFARKLVHDDGNAQAPDFDLVDARLGYREGVRRRGAQREVYVQRTAAAPEQAAALQLPVDGVIDTGFDVFAQRHWAELARGETLHFDYLVPSRRTFFAFKVGRVDNPAGAPPGAITFRLASSSWVSFLLPHIDVSYDASTHRLVRYEGLSNVRDLNGKNYRVRFDYPKIGLNREIGQADIDAALATPLVSSCSAADSAASAAGHTTVPEVTAAPPARNQNR